MAYHGYKRSPHIGNINIGPIKLLSQLILMVRVRVGVVVLFFFFFLDKVRPAIYSAGFLTLYKQVYFTKYQKSVNYQMFGEICSLITCNLPKKVLGIKKRQFLASLDKLWCHFSQMINEFEIQP